MPFLDPRRTAQGPVLPLLALPRADRLFAWGMARMTVEEMAEQVLARLLRRHQPGAARSAGPRRSRRSGCGTRSRTTRKAYLGTLRGLVSSFLRAYLPGMNSQWRLAARITAPTLVIGGLNDKLVDPRVPAQVARVIPDSRLLILPGVGHVAQMEVPRLVARAVVGLLDEVAVPGGRSTAGRRRAPPSGGPPVGGVEVARASWARDRRSPSGQRRAVWHADPMINHRYAAGALPAAPVARVRDRLRVAAHRGLPAGWTGCPRRCGRGSGRAGAGVPSRRAVRAGAVRRRPVRARRRRRSPRRSIAATTVPVRRTCCTCPGRCRPRARARSATRPGGARCWARRDRCAASGWPSSGAAARTSPRSPRRSRRRWGTGGAGPAAAGCGCSGWRGARRPTSRCTWPPARRPAGCARGAA